MLERFIQAVVTDDPGGEEPAATRQRLRALFPPAAVRRMTQPGLLIGGALCRLEPQGDDTVIFASQFGESRTLEGFLESFPTPSPTQFQTSIHPSSVQQALIGRQQATTELFPLAGGAALVGQALLVALLAPARRVLLCGGEERGTWLVPVGAAGDRAFAFGLALTAGREAATLGRVALEAGEGDDTLALAAWFDLLHARRPFRGGVAPGWRLRLEWT